MDIEVEAPLIFKFILLTSEATNIEILCKDDIARSQT